MIDRASVCFGLLGLLSVIVGDSVCDLLSLFVFVCDSLTLNCFISGPFLFLFYPTACNLCDCFLQRRVGSTRDFDAFIAHCKVASINSGIVSVKKQNLEKAHNFCFYDFARSETSVFWYGASGCGN